MEDITLNNKNMHLKLRITRFNKSSRFRYLLTLINILILAFMITGCNKSLYETKDLKGNSLQNTINNINGDDNITTESNSPGSDSDKTESDTIDEPLASKKTTNQTSLESANSIDVLIDSMTLKQKIAQLFIVDFYGMTDEYQIKDYTSTINSFLKNYQVGGVIYFAENIESREQLISMNSSFQKDLAIPLFISIDEEGGLVSRLGNADIGVTHLPDASELGTKTSEEITQLAYDLGLEIKALGFNMDFAPVLDVNTNPDNPVIGNRSFGSDPKVVGQIGSAFADGLSQAGVISSGKHFPGHGDTATDSHLGITIINHDLDRLNSIELKPFKEAIKNDIPSIMMGHISAPEITGDNVPASLSPYMITELLRKDLGYEGLVLSDSLRMQAITDYYTPEEVGVMLLKAGGDLILIPDDFELTYNAILTAVKNGDISVSRINESLKRILQAKVEFGILVFEVE